MSLVLLLEFKGLCPTQYNMSKSPLRLGSYNLLSDRRSSLIGSLWPSPLSAFPIPIAICFPSFSFWSFSLFTYHNRPLLSSLSLSSPLLWSFLSTTSHSSSLFETHSSPQMTLSRGPLRAFAEVPTMYVEFTLFTGVGSVIRVTCTWHSPTVLSANKYLWKIDVLSLELVPLVSL